MASRREQIIATLVAELTAGLAPIGVFRSREIPLTREITPAIVVMPYEEIHGRESLAVDRNQLLIRVEVMTRGNPWDQIADPVAVKAHKIIMTSPLIAGLCDHHRRSSPTSFEANDADQTAGILSTPYEFFYMSLAHDLEQVDF